jgi:hypothetical protein
VTIEVKSAAYLQTWAQKTLSVISFDIAPTWFWEATTNELATEARRQADLYGFALLAVPPRHAGRQICMGTKREGTG